MKEEAVDNKRGLSIIIGAFGCLCLARAAICIYFFKLFPTDGSIPYLSNDVLVKVKSTQRLMLISILIFSLLALVSITSAVGIFLNRAWASKVWLCATIFIFLYVVFACYNNSSEWLDYLFIFFLCLFSWFLLWYYPRKHTVENKIRNA
jgi:hypothetical protein